MNNTERANAAAEDIRISEANTGYALSCDEIREMILKHFPDDGWIPVSERLPEPYSASSHYVDDEPPEYLVMTPGGPEVSAWSDGRFETASTVTHWKEIELLPAPPKEGATK